MAHLQSLIERAISENSLILLLQHLHGRVTTVELRNESSVVGCVQNVDAFMNVRLNDAVFTDQCGRQEHVDQFFVAGRSVRYVHIPDDVNISRAIASQLEALRQFRKGMRSRGNRREFLNVRK
uniref:U7 snRNA-associated Sm-like protein LSm10 isoform X1 n=1 Tax=Myxine glutinosa TaxID=7769 RepID=UPI00358FC051